MRCKSEQATHVSQSTPLAPRLHIWTFSVIALARAQSRFDLSSELLMRYFAFLVQDRFQLHSDVVGEQRGSEICSCSDEFL